MRRSVVQPDSLLPAHNAACDLVHLAVNQGHEDEALRCDRDTCGLPVTVACSASRSEHLEMALLAGSVLHSSTEVLMVKLKLARSASGDAATTSSPCPGIGATASVDALAGNAPGSTGSSVTGSIATASVAPGNKAEQEGRAQQQSHQFSLSHRGFFSTCSSSGAQSLPANGLP